MSEISRRAALKVLGLATASAVAGGAAVAVGLPPKSDSPKVQIELPQIQPAAAPAAVTEDLFPFEGIHQAGVITDPPEAVLIASLDVLATTPDGLVKVMQILTDRSREL